MPPRHLAVRSAQPLAVTIAFASAMAWHSDAAGPPARHVYMYMHEHECMTDQAWSGLAKLRYAPQYHRYGSPTCMEKQPNSAAACQGRMPGGICSISMPTNCALSTGEQPAQSAKTTSCTARTHMQAGRCAHGRPQLPDPHTRKRVSGRHGGRRENPQAKISRCRLDAYPSLSSNIYAWHVTTNICTYVCSRGPEH